MPNDGGSTRDSAEADGRPRRSRLTTELAVALIAALAGGIIGLTGSLVAVYWQLQDGDHHMRQSMRHQAVDKFIDEYAIVKVELQHYGDMRLPIRAISPEDRAVLRKHVHGVEGACARLVLVAPDLLGPALEFRNVLISWEQAISGPQPYDRNRHSHFLTKHDAAQAAFLTQAKAALELV